MLAVPALAWAQAMPPKSDSAAQTPPSIVQQMCDALAGAERERCLAEQKAAPDKGAERAPLGGSESPRSCDQLIGPEREVCLKKGGRIKAGMGATRPPN